MAVSTNLEFPLLTEGMLQKTVAINLDLSMMEKAISEKLVVSTAAAVSPGHNIVLPYSNANDLSTRAALHCAVIELTAGATQDFNVVHPNNKHLFIAHNKTSRVATFTVASTPGATVTVAAGRRQLLYCDGVNFIKNNFDLDTIVQQNDCVFSFYGQPELNQVMGRIFISRDTTFPANFTGARCRVTVAPLIDHTLEVYSDNTKIGQVVIEPDKDYTFTTVSGTSKLVEAGKFLELRNTVVDSLLDEIHVSLVGTNTISQ